MLRLAGEERRIYAVTEDPLSWTNTRRTSCAGTNVSLSTRDDHENRTWSLQKVELLCWRLLLVLAANVFTAILLHYYTIPRRHHRDWFEHQAYRYVKKTIVALHVMILTGSICSRLFFHCFCFLLLRSPISSIHASIWYEWNPLSNNDFTLN